MLRRRIKVDTEHLRIDLSWRLAASLATGLVLGASGAVTWAYAYGKELVATADTHRDQVLKSYPTWPQVLTAIREERQEVDKADRERHQELMKRLERIEDRLMRR